MSRKGRWRPASAATHGHAFPRLSARRPERSLAAAERALSVSLAARRRAFGLTQVQFAAALGVSVTTVGHAETGRQWQSRLFWEKADAVLDAHGELLKLHDVHRTATVPSQVADADVGETAFKKPHANSATVACIVIMWSDGTLTPIVPAATAMLRHGQDGARLTGRPKVSA